MCGRSWMIWSRAIRGTDCFTVRAVPGATRRGADEVAVTPERLSAPAFKKRLAIIHRQRELNRLVVDEAHCISECALLPPPSRFAS